MFLFVGRIRWAPSDAGQRTRTLNPPLSSSYARCCIACRCLLKSTLCTSSPCLASIANALWHAASYVSNSFVAHTLQLLSWMSCCMWICMLGECFNYCSNVINHHFSFLSRWLSVYLIVVTVFLTLFWFLPVVCTFFFTFIFVMCVPIMQTRLV